MAIEASRGLVVDRLLAGGHPVVPVDTRAFNAARPRWGVARAKNDAGDAFRLADYLRTDRHTLRQLAPTSTATLEVQALARPRSEHVAAKVTVINQLHALLGAYWPGARRLFHQLDSGVAMAFLDRFPTPQAAAGLTPVALGAFLSEQRYRSRKTPQLLLDHIHAAPAPASRISPTVVAEIVRSQVSVLRTIVTQIAHLDRLTADALASHPYAALFADLPRIGSANHAQVLGETGPMLERGATPEQLACEVGMAPVTKASGRARNVAFRRAANLKARQAFVVFVNNSRFDNPWAAEVYRSARERGKRHPHAIRILGRAWLRAIHACWRTNTAYQPHHHHAKIRIDPPPAPATT